MYGIKQLYRKDYSGEEVNTIGLFKDSKWAWDTEYKYKRIYLKSDEELTLFTLKFGG